MAKAVSTIKTTLKFGTSSASVVKMCPITSYPDMIGDPETIETTDLDDDSQTSIPGVKAVDALQFEANYTSALWDTLSENENTAGFFELEFGEGGADGTFAWEGQYTLGLPGHGTNEARTMTINVMPSTKISKKSA